MAAATVPEGDWRRWLAPWGAAGGAVVALVWLVVQMGVGPVAPGAFGAVWALAAQEAPWLALWWASAYGLGAAAARGCRLPGGIGAAGRLTLGAAALLAWTWVALWVLGPGAAGAAAALGPGLVCAAVAGARGVRRRATRPPTAAGDPGAGWWLLACTPGVALLLVAAACPPGTLWRVEAFGYDVTSYHLQLPREWVAAGRFEVARHSVYSFLPSGAEATYALLGVLRGTVLRAVYTCQFWHASMAVLAAAAIAGAARRVTGHPAAVLGGAAVLVLPWVLITGSLAYNAMAMIALAAGALRVAVARPASGWGLGVALGLLLGAATLAKLTAGPMLAVPVVLIAGARPWLAPRGAERTEDSLDRGRAIRRGVGVLVAAAAVGTLVLSPYFARNALATGNPVFPFATGVLGTGHWSDAQAARWEAAHGLDGESGADRADAIGRQWLLNTGYGALGGSPAPRELRNIARFDREGGVPVFWLAVAAGAAAALAATQTRRLSVALMAWGLWQVGFWLLATHLQSRFLLPTVLPAGVLLGLGAGVAARWVGARVPLAMPLTGGALMACLSVVSITTLWEQTRPVAAEGQGRLRPAPVWAAVDSLGHPPPHPLNDLPPDARPLLVADNSALLYVRRPLLYASPFDASPLGEVIRAVGDDPSAVTDALVQRGVTHVWAHWGELRRLHATYGYDPAVTEPTLRRLARSWRVVDDPGPATLFALPRPH